MKPSLILLLGLVLAASSGGLLGGLRHVYRPGDLLSLSVGANQSVELTNSLGQPVNLTLRSEGGQLLAIYTFKPSDPPGVWLVTIGGAQEAIYLIRPSDFLLVVLMAALLNVALALGRRKLIDLRRFRRISQELSAFNKEMMRALRQNDQEKLARLKKRERYMKELQGQVAKDQVKLLVFSLAVGYFLYFVLIKLEGGAGVVVAYMPLSIPLIFFTLGPAITMLQFYIIASALLASLVTKALGAGLA
ncbi:MAG: hypothetical protein C4339_00205 [Nitrososphaerota archaeon]